MESLNINTIINLAGLGGFGVFIYYWIKGLNKRITNLTALAEEQNKTLEAARERANEYDKLSQAYKDAMGDFKKMFKNLRVLYNENVEEYIKKLNEQKQQIDELKVEESICDETLIAQPLEVNIDVDETQLSSKEEIRDETLIGSAMRVEAMYNEDEEIESSIENKHKQIEELFNEIDEKTKLIF